MPTIDRHTHKVERDVLVLLWRTTEVECDKIAWCVELARTIDVTTQYVPGCSWAERGQALGLSACAAWPLGFASLSADPRTQAAEGGEDLTSGRRLRTSRRTALTGWMLQSGRPRTPCTLPTFEGGCVLRCGLNSAELENRVFEFVGLISWKVQPGNPEGETQQPASGSDV